MTAKILDGLKCSAAMREGIKSNVAAFTEQVGRPPYLHVILASDDPASRIYVNRKTKACGDVGIRSSLQVYDPTCSWHACKSADEFVRKMLSEKPVVAPLRWQSHPADDIADAVMVQLPIAGLADPRLLFEKIPVDKDVDAFNPVNVGRLMQGNPRFRSCTPAGIMHLLAFHGIDVGGKSVCIINDSNIVGRPLAMMLTDAGATVTVCHKRTDPFYLKEVAQLSDIIVIGVGIPDFLKARMIPKGAIVVDVGINRLEDGKIVGDVEDSAWEKAAWISPVPGGVGPLTVTMLLSNTLQAACEREGLFYNQEPWG